MLGGRDPHARTGTENLDGPAESWKPDMDMVRATIRYAADTGRLEYRTSEEIDAPPEVEREGDKRGEEAEEGEEDEVGMEE